MSRNIPVLNLLADCSTVANPNVGPYDGVPPVTTGTANPAYNVFSEKDSANSSLTLQYQSITCMPQYRGNSFEVSIGQASLPIPALFACGPMALRSISYPFSCTRPYYLVLERAC
jgi:hypothetical protein